jgi:membrane protease YdiL (CAAX protease family)
MTGDPLNDTPPAASIDAIPPRSTTRGTAIVEVLLCSGFPTQLAIVGLLSMFGVRVNDSGDALSPRYVFLVSAIDTVVLLGLIVALLRVGGERPRDVFLGSRRGFPEVVLGMATLPLVLGMVALVQIGIYTLAPFLRTVPENPFESMIESPALIGAFTLLVVIAGGLREELQRAFLLHRFEQHLGGATVGLVITSLAFGLGHVVQGWDAVVVTGLLGATWGVMFLRRRSVVATVTSHALFNAAQVAAAAALTRN